MHRNPLTGRLYRRNQSPRLPPPVPAAGNRCVFLPANGRIPHKNAYLCPSKFKPPQMKYADRMAGVASAAISSATFGFAPFFTKKLLDAGLGSFETLSYRWGFATLFLILVALLSGRSFRVRGREFLTILWLSVLRAATSFLLIIAYANIATGAASTIHFIYPLAVAATMMLFFHERFSWLTLAAIVTSMGGAALLSLDSSAQPVGNTLLGTLAACMSVMTYGGYMVGVKNSRAAEIDSQTLTCYVTGIGALFFIGGGLFTGGIRLLDTPDMWMNAIGLGIPATAVSNITLVWGIKRIGPTMTSFFGALEPLTSVILGIIVFGEPFTLKTSLGVVLIIAAVLLAATRKND